MPYLPFFFAAIVFFLWAVAASLHAYDCRRDYRGMVKALKEQAVLWGQEKQVVKRQRKAMVELTNSLATAQVAYDQLQHRQQAWLVKLQEHHERLQDRIATKKRSDAARHRLFLQFTRTFAGLDPSSDAELLDKLAAHLAEKRDHEYGALTELQPPYHEEIDEIPHG